MTSDAITPPPALADLGALSVAVGSDILLVQGAGGNTSLKEAGVLWVKASGTWLKDAASAAAFVPLDIALVRQLLA